MHVRDLIAMVERVAPPQWSASWDKGGVQVTARREDVRKLAVALDPTPELIDRALAWEAEFILVHHPLSMKPELPSRPGNYNHVLGMLFRHDAWLYAAHTSLDVQPSGPVRWLARELELNNVFVLEETARRTGRWFRILGRAQAVDHVTAKLAELPEIELYPVASQALEVVSLSGSSQEVHQAVAQVDDTSLRVVSQDLDLPMEPLGFGFVGDLPVPQPWNVFAQTLERILSSPPRALAGTPPDMVRRVACCPGSGSSLLARAGKSGAQVYVTGDFKYHDAQAAKEQNILVVDVGHFGLEERMMRYFAEELRLKLDECSVEVAFFPGTDAFIQMVRQ